MKKYSPQSRAIVLNDMHDESDERFTKALFIALAIHTLLVFIRINFPNPVEEVKEEIAPIKVTVTAIAKTFPKQVPIPKAEVIQAKVPSTKMPMPHVKPAPRRLNPHHSSPKVAAPKIGNSAHPGPEVTNKGPKSAKFRAKNMMNKVAAESVGAGGPQKVGGNGAGEAKPSVYKGLDLKSEMGGLLAAGSGTNKVAKVGGGGGYGFKDGSSYGSGIEKIEGTSSGMALQRAAVSGNGRGNLADAASGKMDGESGAAGLVSKKGIFTASLPAGSTEVSKGMDPNAIRQALLDHIGEFRYCYQKVLDRRQNAGEGLVDLHFFIGANGRVKSSEVHARGFENGEVNSCIQNVLSGIQFPRPYSANGIVEVNQPMNFQLQKM